MDGASSRFCSPVLNAATQLHSDRVVSHLRTLSRRLEPQAGLPAVKAFLSRVATALPAGGVS
ncbi:hypothetical protein I6A60_20205 [Frankia sp. AgB1.9]|uniref:hypothetical protein n=1 Tax=unclassified Frankia TaxID=2632575 RepID=UPI0019349E10|nr:MULTISPECIES: hypothetical protein [unclassified Frankia]MBL7491897.1 hypothetical protein [Frankia sp. AgW1.1]MBL7550186.1 hypothetical protein [Frankia sp. AgB1.9]MBL7619845.1 hypothetical protein [Frankia sp. AgB1.8]